MNRNFEEAASVIGAVIVTSAIWGACVSQKPIAKAVHLTADVCVEIARQLGDEEMEKVCKTTGDVAELFERRRMERGRDAGQDMGRAD